MDEYFSKGGAELQLKEGDSYNILLLVFEKENVTPGEIILFPRHIDMQSLIGDDNTF